ncbi:hypothetical protein [Rhodoflexus sp.]
MPDSADPILCGKDYPMMGIQTVTACIILAGSCRVFVIMIEANDNQNDRLIRYLRM